MRCVSLLFLFDDIQTLQIQNDKQEWTCTSFFLYLLSVRLITGHFFHFLWYLMSWVTVFVINVCVPPCGDVCYRIIFHNVIQSPHQQVHLTAPGGMDSPQLSMLSSPRDGINTEDYIQPHYKECYRMAIDRLVSGGRDSYLEFLKGERMGSFLSEEELAFISANVEQLLPQNHTEEISDPEENPPSSGTYWPMYTDTDAPDLDLGWPEILPDTLQTNIDLLFHPPRQNSPTIKEVVRKNIQEARQVMKTGCERAEHAEEGRVPPLCKCSIADEFRWSSSCRQCSVEECLLCWWGQNQVLQL